MAASLAPNRCLAVERGGGLGYDPAMKRRDMLRVLAASMAALAARRAAAQNLNDMYSLPLAAQGDDFQGVLTILQQGTSVDTEGEGGRTGLSFAAANGNLRIVNLLLDHLAVVNLRDQSGDTALHWAALNGHVEMIRRLLAAKAEINAQNKQGVTPLMLAIGGNRRDAVRALVVAGADLKLSDFSGHDAFAWATGKPGILPLLGQR
jgi:uncharacterized protein